MDSPKQTRVSGKNDFRRKAGRILRTTTIIIILVLVFTIYWFFFNRYGEGERKGTLIKITHRGNIFKTDEGEMWLSCRQTMNPEKFYFSVTNDSIAVVLKNLQDECVQVSYVQYRAFLPWRGDNKYIVTGVTPIRQENH
ncbi:MAG: hypothetical protein ACHQFX_17845 [Chitinophagales bacterium]